MKVIESKLDYALAPGPGVLRLFTGNANVNAAGELVMGRGAALEVKRTFPGVAREFGQALHQRGKSMPVKHGATIQVYGLLVLPLVSVGVFQVKAKFSDNADPILIRNSVQCLNRFLEYANYDTVQMNYPGIGYGGLDIEEVEPLLRPLSDKVFLYRGGDT